MEDIARAAQISRTALYQHFGSKEKLLRALSADLYQRAIAGAADAAESEADLAERLYRALDAKMGFFYELLIRSPHGLEILDDNSRLCGDITAEAELEYAQIVSRMLRRGQTTGELSPPSHTMKPQAMAQFFIQCAEGLMGKPRQKPTPTEYRMRLRQLVDGLLVGFGRTAGRSD